MGQVKYKGLIPNLSTLNQFYPISAEVVMVNRGEFFTVRQTIWKQLAQRREKRIVIPVSRLHNYNEIVTIMCGNLALSRGRYGDWSYLGCWMAVVRE